jgi:hypothetical protein
MSQRVTIDFTGLCVFATKNVPERLSVLLAADPSGQMPHRPILSFDVRNLGTFSGMSVDQVIQMPDGTQVASWSLDKRLVTVKAGKSAQPDKVVLCGPGKPKSRCPQNPVSEMDLCWVPSLAHVSGKGDIDPVYLSDSPPHGAKSALAARLDFDCGSLFANAAVNRRATASYWVFDDGAGGKVEQYLADTVRLEFQAGMDEPLTIQAATIGGNSTETLVLHPWNDRIEMSITNLPVMLPMPGMPQSTMPHFAMYYELLKPAPHHKPTPTTSEGATCGPMAPAARAVSPGGLRGVYPVRCTPSQSP